MLPSQLKFKFADLLLVFPLFFTPLLFFTLSHDQFELPKLTFLALMAIPLLLLEMTAKETAGGTPLSWALLAFVGTQTLASLPGLSLSWQTSLMGEYENFAGLTTLFTYCIWFALLSRNLNEGRIQKIFYFNSLAAVLSSLYAIGQHFGFDFIQWNPGSVNATREFASSGNPNFLSAYLAMSLPLLLTIAFQPRSAQTAPLNPPGPLHWFLAPLGLLLLVLGTDKGMNLIHLAPSETLRMISRILGLTCFSIALVRLDPFRSGLGTFGGVLVTVLGLLSTGSRGGFLAAFVGVGLWAILALRNKPQADQSSPSLAQKIKIHPFPFAFFTFCALIFLIFFGMSFFQRLGGSILHFQESLAASRLHIWKPGIAIVRSNPLLGVGLDTFKIAFPYYSGIEYNLIDGMFNSSRFAHNELLQIAATTGLVGLAAYLSVLAAFGYMWWKSLRSATPAARWVLTALFSAAVAYQVQNFFSFGVSTLDFLGLFLLACVQFYFRKAIPPSPHSVPRSLLWKGLCLLLVLLLFLFPLRRLGADVAFGHGSAASELLQHPNPNAGLSALEYYSDYEIYHLRAATSLCPWDVKYQLYLGLSYEHRAPLDGGQTKDWLLQALGSYQKAIEMSPANAYYYNDEGRIYDELGHFEPSYLIKAEDAYRLSVHWAPASPFFLINWSLSLEKIGKDPKAEEELQKAFDASPGFTAKTLGQLAEGNYEMGDKKWAFELVNKAIQGDPTSPEAYYYRGYMYLREKQDKKALADLQKVKSLNPTSEANPTIRLLDQLIEEAGK